MVTIDSTLLLGYYQSRYAATGGSAASATGSKTSATKYAPTPPWSSQAAARPVSERVAQAMAGRKFIDENAARLDLPGASQDYKKLFALYQGLDTLYSMASHVGAKGTTTLDTQRTQAVFAKGLAEVNSYLQTLNLAQIRVAGGTVADKVKSAVGLASQAASYTSPALHEGTSADPVDAFAGAVVFNIHVQRVSSTFDVAVDLSEMGSTTRSMTNVVQYLNDKLAAQGIFTKFTAQRTIGEPRTIMVDGKPVETGLTGPDRWSLKLETDSSETVSLSAPATDPAVYIAQAAGDPNPDLDPTTSDGQVRQQLLKFQTAGTAPAAKPGETYYVDGRLFERDLGDGVGAVRATATGADGSVYVLADITGPSAGQEIKGAQDVALLKYDSAGALVYSRTLGARETASGLALAVSADGKVAVAGQVTGGLDQGDSIPDPKATDSFVAVFDANGDELWTKRQAATADDTATAVAFGADGSIYVAGQTKSTMLGATAVGGQDGYLTGYSDTGVSKFTTQFGSTGTDKIAGLVVDGSSVIVAGAEDGRGVLRRYDIPLSGDPTLAAVRDIGDLRGGSISGLAIDGTRLVVAGSTMNSALSAGAVTRAHAGGFDAFASSLALDLGADAADAVAYYGGSGDDKAAGLAVSGGKAWITGQAGADLPGGLAPVGKTDGYVAGLDIATGAVTWSRRFTSNDQFATPTAITVDAGGASVLDRLGLPHGVVDAPQSMLVTSATSLRDGDQFFVRSEEGARPTAVTIASTDTFDDLVAKVRRALNFNADVKLVTDGAVKRLQITPRGERSTAEILAGPAGRDALESLGLEPGVVRLQKTVKGKLVSGDGRGEIYGLGLPGEMDLASPAGIKAAVDALSKALGVIKTAYTDLKTAASPKTAATAAAISGPVPAYLKSQLANYQAALSRLTGT